MDILDFFYFHIHQLISIQEKINLQNNFKTNELARVKSRFFKFKDFDEFYNMMNSKNSYGRHCFSTYINFITSDVLRGDVNGDKRGALIIHSLEHSAIDGLSKDTLFDILLYIAIYGKDETIENIIPYLNYLNNFRLQSSYPGESYLLGFLLELINNPKDSRLFDINQHSLSIAKSNEKIISSNYKSPNSDDYPLLDTNPTTFYIDSSETLPKLNNFMIQLCPNMERFIGYHLR